MPQYLPELIDEADQPFVRLQAAIDLLRLIFRILFQEFYNNLLILNLFNAIFN
jgi:hypothetical protein